MEIESALPIWFASIFSGFVPVLTLNYKYSTLYSFCFLFSNMWSTNSFIHSKKNETGSTLTELKTLLWYIQIFTSDEVRVTITTGKMWIIGGHKWDSCEGARILEITTLSPDERDIEIVLFITMDREGMRLDLLKCKLHRSSLDLVVLFVGLIATLVPNV